MKKKTVIFFIIVLFSIKLNAKVTDNLVYRIIYNSSAIEIQNGEISDEIAYLDIGNEVTYFYNHDFMMYNAVCDSLKERGYGVHEVAHYIAAKKIVIPKMVFSVLRNYPSAGKTLYAHFVFENYYYYEEETPQIDWQLIAGDTTLLGYQCQKATCKFRGRDWTVYYTMDIPISEGPYKFCGLPGLVMYAADSKGDFTFSCIGIENPNEAEIVVDKSKWHKVEKKKLNKMLVEYYDDTLAWAFKVNGVAELIGSTKRTGFLEPSNLVPCLIETFK